MKADFAALGLIICTIGGCVMSSDVMDAGNGAYLISARAAPLAGGTTGANTAAYRDATKFCATKSPELHAIVIDAAERDVYQTSFGGGASGFAGGRFAQGNANLRFRCGT